MNDKFRSFKENAYLYLRIVCLCTNNVTEMFF